jgi:hypothetical protein
VNWDDLEMALTTSPEESMCYLDLRTGEVLMVTRDRFDDDDDAWPSRDEIHAGLTGGHLLAIEPLGSSVEYRWMAEFTATVRDERLRDRLEVALDGRGAFRRFEQVLAGSPAERRRWLGFLDQRTRAAARAWLADRGIEPTTAPRDRSVSGR